jgi:hypothetical protein
MKHKSLNQLLCAATVNVRFRETLLRDPAKAIASGYFDHSFTLTQEEKDMVVGIQAHRLEDFAAQVYHWISTGSNGHSGNGLNGNGLNSNGVNGNGRNGKKQNGYKGEPLSAEPLVDVYRAPVLVHA